MMKRLVLFLLSMCCVIPALPVTKDSPFACDLYAFSPEIRKRHFDELGPALRAVKSGVRELPNGYEFKFPSDAKTVAMSMDCAAKEEVCCPFFDIEVPLEREGGPAYLALPARQG